MGERRVLIMTRGMAKADDATALSCCLRKVPPPLFLGGGGGVMSY